MSDAVKRALSHIGKKSDQTFDDLKHSTTLHFHPDLIVGDQLVIDRIAAQGIYRSQYETGISSGGMTAYRGGERWSWESAIFAGAYDDAEPSLRPKYGALNHQDLSAGGAIRFGSCHFRMAAIVRARTSFCYPDSHFQPDNFAVTDVRQLIVLATENKRSLDTDLDNYIEAHIHGPLVIRDDCEAVVLDPSYRGTSVEKAAKSLGPRVEWHDGFRLHINRLADCKALRGSAVAQAVAAIAEDSVVTPAILGRARRSVLDYQMAKWVWHCVARFGSDNKTAVSADGFVADKRP